MPQAKTLNESQIKIVLSVINSGRNSHRNRLMFLLSYWAGMRVGEIAAIKICDVVNENGEVLDEIRLTPDQTKGKFSRTVTLSEKLRKEINLYIQHLNKNNSELPLIYSQKSRQGFGANSLCQEFKKIYHKAGINGATSHSGRRTFITALASKGIGVRVLQALAGHKSIATTQVYIDVNDSMKRSAVNLL